MQAVFNPVYHPTKIDTLQNRINLLSHQVDSLNKVSLRNSISTEFYHDIINVNVATFVGIITLVVGVIAVISWRSLTTRFERERQILQNSFDSTVVTQNEKISKNLFDLQIDINELSNKHEIITHEAKRAVYNILLNNKQFELALIYGLEALKSMLAVEDKDQAVYFFSVLNVQILDKELSRENVSYFAERFKECIGFIQAHKIPELKIYTDQIEKKYMQVLYGDAPASRS